MQGDFKGLVSNVTLAGVVLSSWTMYPIDLSRLAQRPEVLNYLPRPTFFSAKVDGPFMPARLFIGAVPYIDSRMKGTDMMPDTFIDPSGWGKGKLAREIMLSLEFGQRSCRNHTSEEIASDSLPSSQALYF